MRANIELDSTAKYVRAKEKVERIKKFYGNLTSYCVVIPALAIFNYITSNRLSWVFFPAIGWGIGILFHAMEVFDLNPILGKNWEEKKIKEFMNRKN